MTYLNETMVHGFSAELKKLAAVNPRLGSAVTLGVLGALGGGGANYLRHHFFDAPDAETSGGRAFAQGALAGGLGGAGLGALLPSGARKAMSRFGMRELHGLTGYMPEGETLRSIHAGAYPAEVAEAQARRAAHKAYGGGSAKEIESAFGGLHRAQDALQAARGAEEWGLTNLPGVLRSMKAHGVLPTISRGAKAQIAGVHPLNKALMVGLPAAGVAQAALSKPPEGSGKGEALGYTGGQLAGGLAAGLMPFGAGQVFQEATGHAGRVLGKGVDIVAGKLYNKNAPSKFREYGPHPVEASDLTKGQGQSTPSETIMTSRAQGYPPEMNV